MQIVVTLISDVTYFKMKKGGVLVLLRAWTRDIEPYDPEEIWVQVRGIPPRWCNWRTISQASSSLGKLVEVDWSSLFTSFFGMVKVKVACKDGSKIPGKRPFEMKKNLYLIQFRVEGMSDMGVESGGNDQGDEDDAGIEEVESLKMILWGIKNLVRRGRIIAGKGIRGLGMALGSQDQKELLVML
jgi:hypothetical protein